MRKCIDVTDGRRCEAKAVEGSNYCDVHVPKDDKGKHGASFGGGSGGIRKLWNTVINYYPKV